MRKEQIIDLVKGPDGTYEPSKEQKENPKKERASKQEKKERQEEWQETTFHQNLSAQPNNPVGNVIHGIQTGIFLINEVNKAINKIMR